MTNIYIYDISFLILFTLAVVIFLYKRRKNLKREGIMYLYKTKVGIKFIDYVGTKYTKTLTVLSYLSVISGYFLMAGMIYFLYQLINIYLFHPQVVQAIKIFPLMPLVPYVPELFKISFLPPFYFTYWIIAIAIIAICHEFAHGIIARRYGVKIKSTGFGFLGPFLAAFVEPDEKQMVKKKKFHQISILAAGTFANLILMFLFVLILLIFSSIFYTNTGIIFDSYAQNAVNISAITMIGGVNTTNLSYSTMNIVLNSRPIKEEAIIGKENSTIKMVEIKAGKDNYLITLDNLKLQLNQSNDYVLLFNDLPAIRAQLSGVITKIDGKEIRSRTDVSNALKNKKVGDKIIVTTKTEKETIDHELVLGEDPNIKDRPLIGIGYNPTRENLITRVFGAFKILKDPTIAYEARIYPEFTLFIYNLIWWLILINFSIALINMWPVAIFDGGRTFMLTIWAITKSEKIANMAFKFVTYLILACLVLVTYGYFAAIFF